MRDCFPSNKSSLPPCLLVGWLLQAFFTSPAFIAMVYLLIHRANSSNNRKIRETKQSNSETYHIRAKKHFEPSNRVIICVIYLSRLNHRQLTWANIFQFCCYFANVLFVDRTEKSLWFFCYLIVTKSAVKPQVSLGDWLHFSCHLAKLNIFFFQNFPKYLNLLNDSMDTN